ncbi:MAG: 16S rRNA (adenine(1518)-N(6)/adenine(1519)-N(6))-dimethyltransferase RsmA [bacterium]
MRKWGQHFLNDKNILREIVARAQLSYDTAVLEIGPGCGALTRELVSHTKKILAVEIDPVLCSRLRQSFKNYLKVLHKNILDVQEKEINAVLGNRWRIVSNLPYYITSPILQAIFAWHSWDWAVLTVQDEVADRLVASVHTKAYGLLSILTQIYTRPEKLFGIPNDAFSPPPRVNSAVVKLTRREQPLILKSDLDPFFKLLKICFTKRRKMILNSLAPGLHIDKHTAHDLLEQAGIDPRRRPETVTIDEFKQLHRLTLRT